MSYINDALHKVQKEKESPYAPYGDVLSTESKKTDKRKKRFLVIGLLIIFFFATGIVALLYRTDIHKTHRAATLVQSPRIATAQPVNGMPPADALKTAATGPVTSAKVAALSPAVIEKTYPAGKTLSAELKENKQKAVIPDNKMKNVLKTTAHPPATSAKAAKPSPPVVGETTPAGKALFAELKEHRQKAVIPDNKMKKESSAEPALANTASLYKQALQKQREGKLIESKELYRKVIKKEPHNIKALNNLGVVYLKLQRYKWAIIRFNDALKIKPNYVDAHYNLACLYAQKNDTQQSLFYLKKAIDFNPEVRQWAANDNDLKVLSNLPEFNKLLQVRDKENEIR